MRLYITGFLKDDSKDDSLQYELIVSPENEQAALAVLGWHSMPAEADGELLLTREQIRKMSVAAGKTLPSNFDLFIGVIA